MTYILSCVFLFVFKNPSPTQSRSFIWRQDEWIRIVLRGSLSLDRTSHFFSRCCQRVQKNPIWKKKMSRNQPRRCPLPSRSFAPTRNPWGWIVGRRPEITSSVRWPLLKLRRRSSSFFLVVRRGWKGVRPIILPPTT